MTHPQFPESDFGCAQRLQAEHDHELRYCQPWQTWMVYKDGVWLREAKKESQMIATEIALEQQLAHNAKNLTRAEFVRRILFHGQTLLAILPEEFDRQAGLLNFTNGTLDLATGDLREHDPWDFLTQQIPYAWVPGADASEWEQHIAFMFHGDKEKASWFQMFVGMAACGCQDREQLFVHLRGKGRNGKGVTLRTLSKALGPYAHPASINLFTLRPDAHSTDVAALRGKRLLFNSEMGRRNLNGMMLKTLTGGDQLTARLIGKNTETFDNQLTVILTSNHALPLQQETQDGLWERYVPLNCGDMIPESQRNNRIDLLLQRSVESSAVASWIVQGYLEWQRLIESGGSLSEARTEDMRRERQEERESADTFGSFLDEEIDLEAHPDIKIRLEDLVFAWKVWAERNGVEFRGGVPGGMGAAEIQSELRSRFGKTVKRTGKTTGGNSGKQTLFGAKFIGGQVDGRNFSRMYVPGGQLAV